MAFFSNRSVGLLLAALALGGCGDDDDTTGAAAPVAEADFVAQFVDVQCGGQASCCQQGSQAFDEAGCRTGQTKEIQDYQAETAKAGLTYDPPAGGAFASSRKYQPRQPRLQLSWLPRANTHGAA